jgi:hypothetical protein
MERSLGYQTVRLTIFWRVGRVVDRHHHQHQQLIFHYKQLNLLLVQPYTHKIFILIFILQFFTNSNNNYPIRGLDNNIPWICYRTGPKGWMDQILFAEYFCEPRAFQSNVHGRSKVVWVDNCTGHNMTLQLNVVLEAKQTILGPNHTGGTAMSWMNSVGSNEQVFAT